LLGLPFDAVDMPGVVNQLRQAAQERRPFLLSTPNLNWIVACLADKEFRDSVTRSDLIIPDGMPLVWVARLLGIPIRKRIAGSDVFEALKSDALEPISVFFFGGQKGVADAACQRLNADSSGLRCVGFEFPGFQSIEEMSGYETIAKINASRADFVVVSLGAKKGQIWIARNRDRLSPPVISHLGAVVNFIAGTASRAPVWIRNIGLEWSWRIKEEPVLLHRYFSDGFAFLWLLIARVVPHAWFNFRRKPTRQELISAAIDVQDHDGQIVLSLRGAWVQENLRGVRESFSKAALTEKNVTLEMGGVRYVDSAFVGLVMLLQGHQKKHGRHLVMATVQEPVRRVIKYCCAEYLMLNEPSLNDKTMDVR